MEYSPRDIPQWKQHRNKTKQKNPIHVDLSFIVFPWKLCYSSILTREPNWDWTKIWQLFYEIIKTLCTWLQKWQVLLYYSCLVAELYLTLCDPMDCIPPGSSCPWDFSGKKNGVGCHFLFHGIFPTQGLSPHLPHWQADSSPSEPAGNIDVCIKDMSK